jgi:hypothetical protein
MSNEDKEYDQSENICVVDGPSWLSDLVLERTIEKFVRIHGQLLITTQSSDWDKNGNFIGDLSDLKKVSEKYLKIFNPQGLSTNEYREAYALGELPWQKEGIGCQR